MAGRKIPVMLRATICGGWEELNSDGRFGEVTVDRMDSAVSDFEHGAPPKDEFEKFVYGLCEQMLGEYEGMWDALGVGSGTSSAPAGQTSWWRRLFSGKR